MPRDSFQRRSITRGSPADSSGPATGRICLLNTDINKQRPRQRAVSRLQQSWSLVSSAACSDSSRGRSRTSQRILVGKEVDGETGGRHRQPRRSPTAADHPKMAPTTIARRSSERVKCDRSAAAQPPTCDTAVRTVCAFHCATRFIQLICNTCESFN